MKRTLLAVSLGVFAGLTMPACGASGSESDGGIGRDVAATVSDTDLLKQAQAAANDVVRNAADCDYVARAAPDVYRILEEAVSNVQTAAGRQSLETVRRQVDRIAEACGVRVR